MQEPLWTCIPFVGMLLCIALFPILAPSIWEKRMPVITGFWAILAVVLLSAKYGIFSGIQTAADGIVNDYLTFIVLLFGLFCVAGNIRFEGDLAGSPRVNVILLLIGTLLSSFIGTTGSSMLMIRPVIQMNSWRSRRHHIMIFFIFLISNIGGCLTPVGDPPLLMGFMQGVPFAWSFRLFPIMMTNTLILLFIFYKIDKRAYRKDIEEGFRPDLSKPDTTLEVE
ncbi:MAG: sodium:proton antiporter, partial [Eubacterium sp.]|nr:sodium:proton antiporter [Eubacterium sp.]